MLFKPSVSYEFCSWVDKFDCDGREWSKNDDTRIPYLYWYWYEYYYKDKDKYLCRLMSTARLLQSLHLKSISVQGQGLGSSMIFDNLFVFG